MIFDTHLHLVDKSRLSYPWLSAAPPLDRDWTFSDYCATAARVGITDVLHMEVDVAEPDIDRENAFVAALMALPGSPMRGAISAARPEAEGFPAWLDRVDRRVVKGVRRVLHTMPDDLSRQSRFRENIRRLGQAGLPFDICVLQRQLPIAIDLIDACQDTTFVLDHCGVPDIAGGTFAAWKADMSALSKRPNISVKISGVTAYARPDWTLDTLRPYVDSVITLFGPHRVVWGSDSPVCTLNSSLDQWVAASHALLSGISATDRAAVLQTNARRIWNVEGV